MNGKVTYRQQVSYCGKARCRKCREGIGHGPYWYAYQTINGQSVRTYVGKELPPDALAESPLENKSHIATRTLTSEDQTTIPSQQFPVEVHIGRTHQSPLVGRDHEFAILCQVLDATGRPSSSKKASAITISEHPQCMVLMGEAGIGKTRLAEEMARKAQQRRWAVLWSRAYAQESGIPYRLWTETLRKVLTQGLWLEQGVTQQAQVFQPLKALLPELHEMLPQTGYSAPLSPEQEQLRLREAVYELLTTISASTPLLIVLDDLQWADGSSCQLFGYLARRLQGYPIVLLGTCRETELPPNHPLRSLIGHMQREHAVETLHIQPLTDDQVSTLVADLPEAIVQQIQTQAAGNPFFAEELARSVGAPNNDVGAQFIAPNATDSANLTPTLPDTITAALNQRLSRLSEPCQQLLGKAAVLGGSFGFHLVQTMEASGSDADEDTLLDLLEEALRSGVLSEEGTGTRITYHFWHPLLASHLYNELSATRRARLHRRAAAALREVYKAREEEEAATITQHLVKGGAEAAEIVRYAELAGNHAYALSAYPEAERHYRLAVEQIEETEHQRVAGQLQGMSLHVGFQSHLAYLAERLAECTRIQGNFAEARHLFERVLEVRSSQPTSTSPAEPQQEAQIQALLWSEIGWTWRYIGDNMRAWQCCEHGEQVLHEAGITAGPAWARLRFQQGSLYWQEGNYEEAIRVTQEALRLFEEGLPKLPTPENSSHMTRTKRTLLGDPADLGRTHALLGALTNAVGQRKEALKHLNTALALYEHHDRQREIAHVCCNIGHVHLKKAEYSLAQSFLRRSLHLAERIGDVPLMSVVFHNQGELAASTGNLTEAETLYRQSLNLAERVNDREYLSLWNADLAAVLQEQGKLEETRTYVHRALTIGRAINNVPCIGNALVALGNLHIAQAKAVSQGQTVGGEEKRTRATKYFLMRARNSLERALALHGLEAETRTIGQLALAQVSLLSGELETARQQATQAMEEARRYELAALLTRCQRLLGDVAENARETIKYE